jgi:hypothetical protein
MKLFFSIPIYIVLFIIGFKNTNCQSVDEYSIKAVWLEKFTHFIDWPDQIQYSSEEFIIGIFDIDPFEGKLELLYENYSIWERPVRIKYIHNFDSISHVHILFLPRYANVNIEKLTSTLKNKPVLIISESEGFAESGTHINFFVVDNKIRFEINESAMHDSGFFVSFRLLKIAKIVKPISKE